MRRLGLDLPLALLALLALGADCEEQLETVPTVIDRSDVAPVDDDGTVWLSSPWTIEDPEREGLIEIQPSSRLELRHGLGRAPVEVHAYVGFSSDAIRVMPASGNSAEIWEVTEDHVIIRNGSGGSFFYRFVLR